VRLVVGRLAGARPAGSRPGRAGDERRTSAFAHTSARKPGRPATSPTSWPAPARRAAQQRATAALRAAEAAATADADIRARLEREASPAAALADVLDARAPSWRPPTAACAEWVAHTADPGRVRPRSYRAGHPPCGDGRQDQRITADEWLAEHAAEQQAEDPHRRITDDADLADVVGRRDADTRSVGAEPAAGGETAFPDIRDLSADEPTTGGEDDIRIPSSDETAATIQRAQRALNEIHQRRAAEERHAAEQARADQLARGHADDHSAGEQAVERAT
jgi:hypothetical protein